MEGEGGEGRRTGGMLRMFGTIRTIQAFWVGNPTRKNLVSWCRHFLGWERDEEEEFKYLLECVGVG